MGRNTHRRTTVYTTPKILAKLNKNLCVTREVRTLLDNTTDPTDRATLLRILGAFGDLTNCQKSWDLYEETGMPQADSDNIREIGMACLFVSEGKD